MTVRMVGPGMMRRTADAATKASQSSMGMKVLFGWLTLEFTWVPQPQAGARQVNDGLALGVERSMEFDVSPGRRST